MASRSENNRKLTGAAAIIMAATLLSRVTGYLRQLLIYARMSPSGYSDEFILAFTLPDLVYDLLAGGAIAAALIPVLSTYIAKNKEGTGWKAVSTFMNLSVIIMLFLEVIFFIFTDGLLGLLAAGYNEGSQGDKALLISLTRILLLSAPFMMLAGQLMGILNAYKKFVMAAFGPVVYNICTIISIAAFGATSATLTAWGVVISAAVFFGLQLYGSLSHFKLYKPKLFLNSSAFKKLIKLAIPSLISSTIIEVNIIISRGFATYYSEGMLTLMNNANRTWQLPLGIFAQSIGIALLPTLSEHFAENQGETFKKVLYKGLRVVFLLSVPTTLFMMILNQDIMRLLFKWGSLSEYDVFYSGAALLGYGAALVSASMVALMIRAFYAIHDSKTPLICGAIGILVNYIFNFLFRILADVGIAGTALAYSISAFINMTMLVVLFYRKTGINIFFDNVRFILKTAMATLPAGLAVFLVRLVISPNTASKLSQIICIIPTAGIGLVAFWYLANKLKIPEIEYISGLVTSRLSRRRAISS